MLNKLNILVAYPYMKKQVVDVLNENQDKIRFLLDSGAFTAWKAGKTIELDDYCRFIEGLPFKPWRYFTLDVIGDPHKSFENYQTMLKRGFNPIPIFTRGEDVSMIDEYYKTSDVLGIGGLVGTKGNKGFVKGIMNKIGERKVHWLGFTDKDFVRHFKPFSCDSSSVTMAGRFGQFELFNKQNAKWLKVSKKDFANKPSKEILNLLSSYGIQASDLSKKNSWHGLSLSERISFHSHVRASIHYKRKIGVEYFLALARVPIDINIALEQYTKEIQ